jgi:tektin-4
MASIQLRQLIDNILEDSSRDMREQCDSVDVNFTKRIEEMEDAFLFKYFDLVSIIFDKSNSKLDVCCIFFF